MANLAHTNASKLEHTYNGGGVGGRGTKLFNQQGRSGNTVPEKMNKRKEEEKNDGWSRDERVLIRFDGCRFIHSRFPMRW